MDLSERPASRLPTAEETRSVSYAMKRINLVHQPTPLQQCGCCTTNYIPLAIRKKFWEERMRKAYSSDKHQCVWGAEHKL